MKKIVVFTFLLLFFGVAVLAQTNESEKKLGTIPLKEALSKNLVRVKIESTGGHTGNTLKLVCKNTASRSALRILIPQGQLFDPLDSTRQTLVNAQDTWVVSGDRKETEVMLQIFCTQAGDVSPDVGCVFSTAALASEPLRQLLKYMAETEKMADASAQAAVWSISSQHPLAGISDLALRKFTAELLGKDMPGYNIKYRTVEQVPGRRADLGKAMVVEGNFIYSLEQDEIVFLVLLDASGKVIKRISKDEKMIKGEHRSGIRLEVHNLSTGKYTLRMQTKKGDVIKDMPVEF